MPLFVKAKLILLMGSEISTGIVDFMVFLIGALVMTGFCFLSKKIGYTIRNVAIYTIGLPGFFVTLLFFAVTLNNGDGDGSDM